MADVETAGSGLSTGFSAFGAVEAFEDGLLDTEFAILRFKGGGRASGLKEFRLAESVLVMVGPEACARRFAGGVDRVRMEVGLFKWAPVVLARSCSPAVSVMPDFCGRCLGRGRVWEPFFSSRSVVVVTGLYADKDEVEVSTTLADIG